MNCECPHCINASYIYIYVKVLLYTFFWGGEGRIFFLVLLRY